MRVLISDDLSPEAKAILERIPGAQVDVRVGLKSQELREIIGGYEALAVRSATKVTKEILDAAQKLRVVGRAGTGVDNIDLAAASRRGVVSVPNMIRSWYFRKNFRAVYGWRPSSEMRASMSTYMFGYLSSLSATAARSSALLPK